MPAAASAALLQDETFSFSPLFHFMAPFRKIQIKPPASKLLSLPAGALAPLML